MFNVKLITGVASSFIVVLFVLAACGGGGVAPGGPGTANPILYVTNVYNASVSAFDTGTNAALPPIKVPSCDANGSSCCSKEIINCPLGIAMSPDGTQAYVTGQNFVSDGKVFVLDTQAGAFLNSSYDVGIAPAGLAATKDGKVYVANTVTNGNGSTVSVINTKTGTVSAISVNIVPVVVAVANTSRGTLAYAAGLGLSVINTSNDSVIKTLAIDGTIEAVAVSHDQKTIYLAIQTCGDRGQICTAMLSALNTSDDSIVPGFPILLAPISAPQLVQAGPFSLCVTPDGKRVYASIYSGLAVFDTQTKSVVETLAAVPGPLSGLAVTPKGDKVFAVGFGKIFIVDNTKSPPQVAGLPLSYSPSSSLALAAIAP